MAKISAEQVKALRERTGAGMMECKKALVETDGDRDRAAQLLRERGIIKASKKVGRATSEGRIAASVSPDTRLAALVELNCETDFVAKTDDYAELSQRCADAARDVDPADVDVLRETLREQLTAAIAKLGENIQLRRFERIEAPSNGAVASYVHAGGKIGTLVRVGADDPSAEAVKTLAHNVCMHVAAVNPSSVSRDDLAKEVVDNERQVLIKQAAQEGKPANIIEKMVEGRLGKFFKEVVLLEQQLVMDSDITVATAAERAGAQITGFRRLQLGEELEE